jgi:hypothetical protein
MAQDSSTPINLSGVKFFDVEEISVNEYHPLPNGQGEPSQVHMMMKVSRMDHPLIVRFKSTQSIDQLIVALITHRNHVWPKQGYK